MNKRGSQFHYPFPGRVIIVYSFSDVMVSLRKNDIFYSLDSSRIRGFNLFNEIQFMQVSFCLVKRLIGINFSALVFASRKPSLDVSLCRLFLLYRLGRNSESEVSSILAVNSVFHICNCLQYLFFPFSGGSDFIVFHFSSYISFF